METIAIDRQVGGWLALSPAVLCFYLVRAAEDKTPSGGQLPEPLVINSPLPTSLVPIAKSARFSGNQPILQDNALSGFFFDNPLIDQDGVFRRVPMLQEYNGQYYQSLSLAVVRSVLGMPPVEFIISGDTSNPILEALAVGGFRIPVDNQSGALVPYYGGRGTFEYISVSDVFKQTVPKEKLAGAIVLLGASAPGLLDLRTTPIQSVYPGVEVHANLIAGILHQSFKHQPTYTIGGEILVLTILGLLLTFTLPRLNPLPLLIGLSLLFAGIWYGNLLLLTVYKLVFSPSTPSCIPTLLNGFPRAYGQCT